MKKFTCKYVLPVFFLVLIALKTYSQESSGKPVSYTEFKSMLSGKHEMRATINWSKIGNKIFKKFTNRFHIEPIEAQWSMVDDTIFASFVYENKERIAVYNKKGRLVRLVTNG